MLHKLLNLATGHAQTWVGLRRLSLRWIGMFTLGVLGILIIVLVIVAGALTTSLSAAAGPPPTFVGCPAGQAIQGIDPQTRTVVCANITLPSPESWHDVGAPGEPLFQNDYHNIVDQLPGSDWATAAFYKDPLGVVHLRGSVDSLSIFFPQGVSVFTLPAGYRPSARLRFSNTVGFPTVTKGLPPISIDSSGVVSVRNDFPGIVLGVSDFSVIVGNFASFDGISFRAEQ